MSRGRRERPGVVEPSDAVERSDEVGPSTVRLRIVNPNTDAAMTAGIDRAGRKVAGPGTLVETVRPSTGPASIESHYDEALPVPGILEVIRTAVREDTADGFVIACFGDPGLEAAREVAQGRPVVGIAQGAMHLASLTGRSFSVVTTLSRTEGRAWDLAHAFGFAGRCRSVRSCEIPVLELDDPGSDAARVVTAPVRHGAGRGRLRRGGPGLRGHGGAVRVDP